MSAPSGSCNLVINEITDMHTNCATLNLNFEDYVNFLSFTFTSVEIFKGSSCSGDSIDFLKFSSGDSNLDLNLIDAGDGDFSFSVSSTRGKKECFDFGITLDQTPPSYPDEFRTSSPVDTMYQNGLSLSLVFSDIDVEDNETLSIHTDSSCASSAYYEKEMSESDTNLTIPLTSSYLSLGRHEFYLKRVDFLGNEACFSTYPVIYEIVSDPTFSLVSPVVSPSDGSNFELSVSNSIPGSTDYFYQNGTCQGTPWHELSPTLASSYTQDGLSISLGGEYEISYKSISGSTFSVCQKLADTQEVYYQKPSVTSLDDSWHATPSFSVDNLQSNIVAGTNVDISFYYGTGCQSEALMETKTITFVDTNSSATFEDPYDLMALWAIYLQQ